MSSDTVTQKDEDITTRDMSEYFLKEYQKNARTDRELYLEGTMVTAVVAGRSVPIPAPRGPPEPPLTPAFPLIDAFIFSLIPHNILT